MEDIMMFEVDEFFQTDVRKLNESSYYKNKFKDIFGINTITSKEVAYALAQFFRSMVSVNSRFDQYIGHTMMFNARGNQWHEYLFLKKAIVFIAIPWDFLQILNFIT